MNQEKDSSRGLDGNELTKGFAKRFEEWAKTTVDDTQQDREETDSELPRHTIYGFDNEIESLKNFLLAPKFYKHFKSLVVVGEYGVGKTTLCKMTFNDNDVRSVYAPRIWVSIPSNGTKECFLKKILTGLGVEDSMLESIHEEVVEEIAIRQEEAGVIVGETAKEKELSSLLYALHLNLRWKKYLIVFDDVRGDDHWNEKLDVKLKESEKWGKSLSDGFPKGSGGRVIYTTRDENLAKTLAAEEQEIHCLWPLSDQKSVWNIYDDAVVQKRVNGPTTTTTTTSEYNKYIDELMNKSRGLPLAARLLAEFDPLPLGDEKDDMNGSNNGESDPAKKLDKME